MNARTTTRCLGLLTRTALLLGLLLNSVMGWAQGSEDFTNLPTASPANYLARTWTGTNAVTWTAAGARTDQTLTGKAICFGTTANNPRTVTSPSYTGGMGTLTFNYVRGFTGTGARSIEVWVNGTQIGTSITVNATSSTVQNYSNTINIAGNVVLEIRCTGASQVIVDDIAWTGFVIQDPVITSMTPAFATAGASAFTLSVSGSNYISGLSTVRWNGATRTTTFVSSGQLDASISSADVASAGSATVDVITTGAANPSNSLIFTINPNTGPDCLGTIGGTALPGTGCDDLDACTTGETWSAACVCQGGTFQDADGDGTCDANDGCPSDPLKIAAGTCGCGNPEPGATCDDGDPCTINDVLTSCSTCAGTTTPDSDGDGVCDGEDGCPNDPSKIFPGLCGCGLLEVGNVCDDGNACTINDIYVSCGVCAGTSPSAFWNFGTTVGDAATTTNAIPDATPGSVSSGNNFGTVTNLLTTTSASSGYSGASGQFNAGAAARAGALNTGANGSAYFEFTVTPAASFGFTLNGISFGSRSTGSGPVSYSLRSSTDNYASEVAGGAISANSAWALKSNTGLSAASAGDQPVTFRLYGYGSVGNPSSGTVNWRIDDLSISGCTVLLPTYTLSVARSGAGSGMVSSSPAGITCGTLCDGVFASGTVVTLTATPDAGSAFTGWSGGGCSGTGTCATTVSAASTVTATFDQDSDGDGIGDATDVCQATAAVTGSPLFDALSCGANPGAYLDFSTINSLQVATAISTCPAGSSCAGGTAPAVACPAGSFSSTTGASTCSSCAASCGSGTVETQACTSTTDRVCDLDSDDDGIPDTIDACQATSAVTGSPLFDALSCGANPGAYLDFSTINSLQVATAISECPAGSYCTGGTAPSALCPPGHFSDVMGSAVCQACAAGSFSAVEGSQVCQSCAAGTYNPVTGATECLTCSGTTNTPTGATSCTVLDSDGDGIPDSTDDCQATAAVTGSPLFNAATCGANPGAYLDFSDVSGVQVATAISECPAGSYCTGGTAPSVLCPPGHFSDATGSAVCQACAAGSFQDVSGATECTACAAGKISSVTGATECVACAAGTYNPLTGQTVCLSCTGGTDATTAATVCLDYPGSPYCPVGTATPTLSGGSGGALYTCSSGQCSSLVLNPATGEVDLAASAPGTYMVCASGACVEVVIHPPAVLNPPTVSQTGGSNPTCSSSPVEFHATGTYSDGSSYDSDVSYVWSDGGGTIPSGAFFAVSSPVSGDVSVSVTSSRVCASSTPVVSSNTISLVVTPTLSIDASSLHIEQTVGTTTPCSGSALEFHVTGLYSDGSSATNDLSATWAYGVITIVGQNFGASADASASAVSVLSVTSTRSCVSNSGSVEPPPTIPVTATISSTLSLVSLDVTSGSNPTCSGTSRQLTATAHFSDGSSSATRPPGETQYDFYLNGALVQSSTNPLYEDDGTVENPLYVTVSSARPCLSGPSSLSSSTVSLQVTAQVAYALDADNDNYYVTGSEVSACSPPSTLYRPVSELVADGDCDDSSNDVNPGATEVCDGGDVDEDCDSFVNEGSNVFYRDADGDTYGDVSVSVSLVCILPPSGFVSDSGDCDDTDASVHPNGTETCDNADEDCDGAVDEGSNVFYRDADGDTYGDVSVTVSLVCTAPPSGFVGDATDCDDTDASVHPNGTETCDNADEDCDGAADEGSNVFYRDADGDTYGDEGVTVSLVCTAPPSGFVTDATDCDDTDASVHPNGTETCDNQDEDCDSHADNGDNLFYRDADGDTYGDVSVSVSLVCTLPPSGFVSNSDDCDDTDASVHPNGTETCDDADEDCDGAVDEGSNVYFADSDGDGFGDALVSVSRVCTTPPSGFVSNSDDCDDAHLLYADTDGDGIGAGAPVACGVLSDTDDCPNVQGVVGSSCDDGSTATTNDALSASCVCTGTPACTTNPVTLTLNTDANAAQITWYVMLTGTNTAVCSGNGLVSSSTIAVDCCLPNGCYDLVITDDFGDGIVGGGYVLRDGTGKRIIDNAGNGGGFTTLSLSPLGFCVPLGADALMATSCDVETATLTTVLRAEPNAAVTAQFGVHNSNSGYQFWVTNPNGGYSRRILFTHAAPGTGAPAGTAASLKASYFLLSSMNSSAPLIPQGILLNVRVRSDVNGVLGNFGPACRLMIPVPPCATTQLTTTASPVVSCGATGLTNSSVIWANNVAGATGYQFEFSKPGYTRRILSPTRSQALSFVTLPLQMNNCYQVRVRISYDNSATYCPFGPYCTITLGTANCGTSGMALEGSGDETVPAEEARLSLWPNPNDGSILNISLTAFDATVSVVSMDVTDVYGKLVATRTLPVQDGRLNTAVSFEQDLAPGLYLVNMTAGEHRYTERLVIQ